MIRNVDTCKAIIMICMGISICPQQPGSPPLVQYSSRCYGPPGYAPGGGALGEVKAVPIQLPYSQYSYYYRIQTPYDCRTTAKMPHGSCMSNY